MTTDRKIVEGENIMHERCANGGRIMSDSAEKEAPIDASFQNQLAGYCRSCNETLLKLEELEIEILARYSKVEIYDLNYEKHIRPYLLLGFEDETRELMLMSASQAKKMVMRKNAEMHGFGLEESKFQSENSVTRENHQNNLILRKTKATKIL